MTPVGDIGPRLWQRWRWWRHTWPFQFAHGPLCRRHRRHVVRIGRLWICRSCLALYVAAALAFASASWLPLSADEIAAVLLWLTPPVLLLSLPPLYRRLPRSLRDLLRAGAGLLLGLSVACAMLGAWQRGGAMLLGLLLVFAVYNRLRLRQRASLCDACPELGRGRVCTGYRRQAVYIRRYQDEMAAHQEKRLARERGWEGVTGNSVPATRLRRGG